MRRVGITRRSSQGRSRSVETGSNCPDRTAHRRVDAIQNDTAGATTAITEIAEIIGQINDYQTTIASAVEEQGATTAEMNRSVAEAATPRRPRFLLVRGRGRRVPRSRTGPRPARIGSMSDPRA